MTVGSAHGLTRYRRHEKGNIVKSFLKLFTLYYTADCNTTCRREDALKRLTTRVINLTGRTRAGRTQRTSPLSPCVLRVSAVRPMWCKLKKCEGPLDSVPEEPSAGPRTWGKKGNKGVEGEGILTGRTTNSVHEKGQPGHDASTA